MRYLKYLALLGVLILPAAFAQGQVAVGVGYGVGYGYVAGPPVCRWGYYDYYPYACAPYGYYGSDWFVGGLFIGAGPWYHSYWGRGYYGGGWGYSRGFYGRRDWDHGRDGFEGRGYASRSYAGGGYGRAYARGGYAHGSYGGGGFHGGRGGGFHGGGGGRR
jgi:hypothetical protein